MSSFEFSVHTRQSISQMCNILLTRHLQEYWTNVLEWEVSALVRGCETVVSRHAEVLLSTNLDQTVHPAVWDVLGGVGPAQMSLSPQLRLELEAALAARSKLVAPALQLFDAELQALGRAIQEGLPRQLTQRKSDVRLDRIITEAYQESLVLLHYEGAEMPEAFMRPQISKDANAQELEHLRQALSSTGLFLETVSPPLMVLLTNDSLWSLVAKTSWSLLYTKVAVLVILLTHTAMLLELRQLRQELSNRNGMLMSRQVPFMSNRGFSLELMNPMSGLLGQLMPHSVLLPSEAELNAVLAQLNAAHQPDSSIVPS